VSKLLIAVVSVLIALAAPLSLAAKGRTVKITITGSAQSVPVEIVDPAVSQFSVWSGPGTFINGVPQTEGFIINWAKGPVAQRPHALRRYQVAFYTGCKKEDSSFCNTDEPQLSYVVIYEYDPAAKQGYVYLPGRGEPWYEVNTRSILRTIQLSPGVVGNGLEGNWFLGSADWQRFAAPFLSQVK
jgi:hypothetical protein